jgi:hypothetical protein
LPDETRAALLRASDDGDLSPSETATVARKLDEPGNGDVLRTVRNLDETEQRRAFELIGDAEDSGVRLIRDLDDRALRTLLKLNPDSSSSGTIVSLRRNLAYLDEDGVGIERIEGFVQNIDRLTGSERDIDGLSQLIKRSAEANNPGSFVGVASEAAYASRNVDTVTAIRVDIETPSSGRPGDIDAVENVDGERVGSEIKESGKSVSRGDIGQIEAGFQQLVEADRIDQYQFAFRELEDSGIRSYLEQNDIPYKVLSEE